MILSAMVSGIFDGQTNIIRDKNKIKTEEEDQEETWIRDMKNRTIYSPKICPETRIMTMKSAACRWPINMF